MSEGYKPPFTMTEEITNLVIEIVGMTGMIALTDNLSKNSTIRRENRIHFFHSSLAVERRGSNRNGT